jgi:crotonobetaine/carnitine-CoA ligase
MSDGWSELGYGAAVASTASISLAPADRTVATLLRHRASSHEESRFLTIGNEQWTFADAARRGAGRAATLADAGVARGDRVVALLENGPLLAELFFACCLSGSVLVPVNTASRGPQLEHVLADSRPTLFVTHASFADAIANVFAHDATKPLVWLDGNGSLPGALPVPPLGTTVLEPAAVSPEDALAILYTSGTTGPPKGVVCPHAQFWWWGRNTGAALGIVSTDALYTCLPMFHTNALNTLVQALAFGVPIVVGERFSASKFWNVLCETEATVTYILGTMASILVAREPSPVDRAHRLRVALAPGTASPLWQVLDERFGIRIVEGHGMTETNLAIGPCEGEQRPGWMGRVMPGFEARVVDDHDADVPPDTPGELLLRSDEPLAFATGYWELPDATADAWRDGWFHTGDRVVRDEEGWFRFLDRIKDAIRRRGENVSAWEVEQALSGHPQVAAAAAIPVPSPLGEDDVMACVVPRGEAPAPEDLIRWLEQRLPYFAVPRYLEFLDELPLTENGKIRKYVLRERGVTTCTWDREAAGVTVRRPSA